PQPGLRADEGAPQEAGHLRRPQHLPEGGAGAAGLHLLPDRVGAGRGLTTQPASPAARILLVRILFLSDFHGRVPDISEWDADVVIAGGDYCEVDEIRDLKFAAMARGWSATE